METPPPPPPPPLIAAPFWASSRKIDSCILFFFLTELQLPNDMPEIQSNFNGSNTFGTMKIPFETGVVRANEGW